MTMQPQTIEQRLRVLQILHGSLVMGVVTFAAVVFVLGKSATMSGTPLLALRLGCCALLAISVVASLVIRKAVVRWVATRTAATELESIGPYVTVWLTKAALAEGAALLAAVTFMLSADLTDAALIGAGLAILASMIPTRGRWERFMEDVKRLRH